MGVARAIWTGSITFGLVSIPVGFLCGVIGTLISKDTTSQDRYDELSVRALTGAGAERPSLH